MKYARQRQQIDLMYSTVFHLVGFYVAYDCSSRFPAVLLFARASREKW